MQEAGDPGASRAAENGPRGRCAEVATVMPPRKTSAVIAPITEVSS
jgi:hypothetical protein